MEHADRTLSANGNTNPRFWSEMETGAVGARYGKQLRELTNGVCCKCA